MNTSVWAGERAGQAGAERGLSPAPYERIKRYVVERIADGTWKPGDAIPSETVFAREFGVARMTVNRALRELSAGRILTRVQGAGTFVTPRDHESPVLEIRNIADEVALRGHAYSARVLALDASSNPQAMAALAVDNAPVFHSRIVHYEDETAIQYEDRYVNPRVFPDYLNQDVTAETPNHYMVRLAPIQRAEFRIYARKPSAQIRRYLSIDIGEPCLLIWRRTWVGDAIATTVHLWHSASRFHLAGKV